VYDAYEGGKREERRSKMASMTDEQLEKEYGRRPEGQPFDQPQELGYICPKGHGGD